VLKKLALGAVAIIVGIIVADNVPGIGGHVIALAVWAIGACAVPAKERRRNCAGSASAVMVCARGRWSNLVAVR
jgi:hypothetical protein